MRARLKELSEAYDGDKEDERALFDGVVVPLTEEVGLPYTYDEVTEFAKPKDDDEDITADEAKAVAGAAGRHHVLRPGFKYRLFSNATCNSKARARVLAFFVLVVMQRPTD